MSHVPNLNASGVQRYCPLLEMMRNQNSNNTNVNLVVVVIHGLVSCIGILQNALIIWMMAFCLRHRTVSSVWVLNLATSDFLATLTLPLFTAYLHSSNSWELGPSLCKAQSFIYFLNMFVTSFLLAVISMDRFFLVVKPLWSKHHRSVAGAWKVCALGWLWAALNALPYALFRSVIERGDGTKMCYHDFASYLHTNESLETECKMRERATAISKVLLAFFFPLLLITVCNIVLVLKLRTQKRKMPRSTRRLPDGESGDRNSGSSSKPLSSVSFSPAPTPSQVSKHFTKMVAFVITSFALFWAPYHIFCLMELASQDKNEIFLIVEKGLPLAATFTFLNPILNPILYSFSFPHFCVRLRQSLSAAFGGLVEEGERGSSIEELRNSKYKSPRTIRLESR